MENSISTRKSCCCTGKAMEDEKSSLLKAIPKTNKTLKAIPSVVLSILIAFFPKCPLCWAVYMSMFGSLGLAQLPYMGWLFPVLIGFLGLHLYMIYKKSMPATYGPFLLSLIGTLLIIMGRFSFGHEKWILVSGMIFIISGSLLMQFPAISIHLFKTKHN